MKKILLSGVMALALLVVATSATLAVFSDEDKVLGNTITAAHLTLDAREVINKPMNLGPMLPGDWCPNAVVDLYNDGNVEHYQYMYVENVVGDLCPYVELKLGYSYNDQDPHSMDVVYGTFPLSALKDVGKKVEVGRWDPMPVNYTTRLVQIAHIMEAAGNDVQMDTCTWDEVFVASQL